MVGGIWAYRIELFSSENGHNQKIMMLSVSIRH